MDTECAASAIFDEIVVVLHHPQNPVNIGGTIRGMKNLGFRHLRLVAPAPFDIADITGIAHRSEDILHATQIFDDLDAALADTIYVIGTTERVQGKHAIQTDIRNVAPEILQRATYGPVALLFGQENKGLDKAALDRCHLVVRLPTDPNYPSLNLAQAVLLLLYELRRSTDSDPFVFSPSQQPASTIEHETLFAAWEQALHTIEFFKAPTHDSIMRQFRSIMHRAYLDQHEAALLTAMAREISKFVTRQSPR